MWRKSVIMREKGAPSFDEVNEIMIYNPETGKIFHKKRTPEIYQLEKNELKREFLCASWNIKYAYKEAMASIGKAGYLEGQILGYRCRAHRVAWLLYCGEWPNGYIDHINGNPADNRIDNLRCVSHSENCRNVALKSNNKSGATGVYYNKENRRWIAQIAYDGKTNHIGSFKTLAEAKVARKIAEEKHGYHPNHGQSRPPIGLKRHASK